MKAWNEEYKGIVEYRPNYVLTGVDVATLTAKFETADDVKADVLNVDSAAARGRHRGAGRRDHGEQPLVRSRLPVVRVDQGEEASTCSATRSRSRPACRSPGTWRTSTRRSAAAAIVSAARGPAAEPGAGASTTRATASSPTRTSCTWRRCTSTTGTRRRSSTVPGSGGLSPAMNALEGEYAFAWAKNIWADMLA